MTLSPELDERRRTDPGHFVLSPDDQATGLRVAGKLRPALDPFRGGVSLDDGTRLEASDAGDFGFFDRFTIGAWIQPEEVKNAPIVSRMSATDHSEGYRFGLHEGKLEVHLVKRWLDDAIRIETIETLKPSGWHHVAFSYDGSRTAAGVRCFIDGHEMKTKVILDELYQNFAAKEPFRIGRAGSAFFKGDVADVTIHDRVLSSEDMAILGQQKRASSILISRPEDRSAVQAAKLRAYFLERHAPDAIKAAQQRLLHAEQDLADFDDTIPTTMVMQEMPAPLDTHILLRGEYDKKGAKVAPGLPAALPPLPKDAPNNRLGFARWLVDRSNPLTARVTVNRFWQMLFGVGIVKTVEDFGAQGEWPTHPELLDWLAVEFMEPSDWGATSAPLLGTGAKRRPWDVKRLLKTIVTSATYRQSSHLSKTLAASDPDNRLLARGPRVRLPAEIIRDQALFASGLLTEKIGGPSVHPYQPPGLEKELHGTNDYVQDHGPSLYRRSLYLSWRRTVPPPALTTFDAAGRETCVVRETRTNTPLQALNLLNDVTYVEAARVLAQRVLKEKTTDAERLTLAFRLAACRTPGKAELAILERSLNEHRLHYVANHAAARKLIATGEYPQPEGLDDTDFAAYTAVANTILNLDEVVTKE